MDDHDWNSAMDAAIDAVRKEESDGDHWCCAADYPHCSAMRRLIRKFEGMKIKEKS